MALDKPEAAALMGGYPRIVDLPTVADELYALTPQDFTRTRDERARAVRSGDRSLADAIGRLRKPSTAAWVVNMLVRRQGAEVSEVLDLGTALRRAQENLDGEELRELTRRRRRLTGAVTSQARDVANDLGVRVSDSVAAQVEETLRAAMTHEVAAKAVRTGQLVEALSATGLGDLDVSSAVAVPESIGMTARPVTRRKPELRVVESPEEAQTQEDPGAGKRALEEAMHAVQEAEAADARSAKKLEKTQKRVARLEARSLQLQGELEEVRRRAAGLEHELEMVDDDLTSAEEKRDRAENRQAEARATLEQARAALVELR